jgi:hypothetical protein
MAQNPYSPVQEIEPSATPPDDYQHIRASPESFGSLIAQGKEKLGAGEERLGGALEKTSTEAFSVQKFFGQVAADNASNDFQDFTTKLLHGDPNKPGPDGQPDTGYMGLRGRAALDARPNVSQAIDDKLKEIRSTLQSPEQQLQFDNFSRRYRAGVVEKVGTHADGQVTEWGTTVNTSTANLAAMHIANNADSDDEYMHGREDIRAAYVKNAQLKGGGPEAVGDAIRQADQMAITARLNAVAVHDPARAMALLEKHRSEAGLQYDNLATSYRTRADQQIGDAAANDALKKTYVPATPDAGARYAVLGQAGAPYGVSPDYLQRVHEIEGNGTSSAGAQGPFQFMPKTATQYGLKNPNDWAESAAAAARLTADNRTALTGSLGRPPTDAELYIAHQQGSGGAAALLGHPNVRAGSLVGDAAIRQNGGDPDAPAIAFTSMWAQKFNASPSAAQSASRKSAAFQTIMADTSLSDVARQHAIVRVNQQIAAQQVAEEEDAKARKLRSDTAMDGFVQRMLTSQNTRNIVNEIASDPNLTPEVKWSLGQAAEHRAGDDLQSASQSYGPGFWNAYKAVTAGGDDPSKITDVTALLKMAGPDTDPEHRITLEGVGKLAQTMSASQKSVQDASVTQTKTALLNYAKSKLSFEQDTGPIKIRDPKGEQLFNAQFIPKFEAAYDQWVKAGKNPYEFLSQKNVDELMKGMRNSSEMAQDRLRATGEEPPAEATPPAPFGVDEKPWQRIMGSPPKMPNGQTWPMSNWGAAIERLRANPTPEMQAAFDKKFAPSGYTAKDILGKLPVPKKFEPTGNKGIPVTDTGAAVGLGIRG